MFAIAILSTLLTIAYGVLHDQVTIRICPEYFTVFHPHLIDTDSLIVLAAAWGVVATWWVGLPFGLALGLAATMGARPKRSVGHVVSSVAIALGFTAGAAALAGMLGFIAASTRNVFVVGPLAGEIPTSHHAPFIAVLWTHLASYGIGGLAGAVLVVRTWKSRRIPAPA